MDVTLFKSDPTPEVRDDQRARIVRWVEPYASEVNTTQLDVMYAYKITGHFGTYRSADACFLEAELPFYFKPVFTTAFSIDFRHRSNHRLMRHMISRLDPRLACVETSTGAPGGAVAADESPSFSALLRSDRPEGSQQAQRKRSFGRTLLPSRATAWWCPAAARKAALASIGLNGQLLPGRVAIPAALRAKGARTLPAPSRRAGVRRDDGPRAHHHHRACAAGGRREPELTRRNRTTDALDEGAQHGRAHRASGRGLQRRPHGVVEPVEIDRGRANWLPWSEPALSERTQPRSPPSGQPPVRARRGRRTGRRAASRACSRLRSVPANRAAHGRGRRPRGWADVGG